MKKLIALILCFNFSIYATDLAAYKAELDRVRLQNENNMESTFLSAKTFADGLKNRGATQELGLWTLAFTLVLGKAATGAYIYQGNASNLKCLASATDVIMIGATLTQLISEIIELKKLEKDLRKQSEKFKRHMFCLDDPHNSECWLEAFPGSGMTIIQSNPDLKEYLGPKSGTFAQKFKNNFDERTQLLTQQQTCLNTLCQSECQAPCDPATTIQVQSCVKNREVQTKLTEANTQKSQSIQDLNGALYQSHTPEINPSIIENKTQGLELALRDTFLTKQLDHNVEFMRLFKDYEYKRTQIYQAVGAMWATAAGIAAIEAAIPMGEACLRIARAFKILLPTTMAVTYYGNPKYYGKKDIGEGKVRWHPIDADFLEKLPGIKGMLRGSMDNTLKLFSNLEDLSIDQRKKAGIPSSPFTKNSEELRKEKFENKLILGLIPYQSDMHEAAHLFVTALEGFRNITTMTLKSKKVEPPTIDPNHVQEFTKKFYQNVPLAINDVNEKIISLDSYIASNQTVGSCTIDSSKLPPIETLQASPSDPAPSSPPEGTYFDKIRKYYQDELKMKVALWNVLSNAIAKKVPPGKGCIDQKLAVDGDCKCRKTKTCFKYNPKKVKGMAKVAINHINKMTHGLDSSAEFNKLANAKIKFNEKSQKEIRKFFKEEKIPMKKLNTEAGLLAHAKALFKFASKGVESMAKKTPFIKSFVTEDYIQAKDLGKGLSIKVDSPKVVSQKSVVERSPASVSPIKEATVEETLPNRVFKIKSIYKGSKNIWDILHHRYRLKYQRN